MQALLFTAAPGPWAAAPGAGARLGAKRAAGPAAGDALSRGDGELLGDEDGLAELLGELLGELDGEEEGLGELLGEGDCAAAPAMSTCTMPSNTPVNVVQFDT